MIKAAGVDTWSVAWYLEDQGAAANALRELATDPAPRSKLIPDEIGGHRVGWFPGVNLMFAEGHPYAGGLARGEDLQPAFERLQSELCDYGILPPRIDVRSLACPGGPRRFTGGVGFAGVRRLDSTVDAVFEDGLEGLAVLAGVAALPIPRVKKQIVMEDGGNRVETVYYKGWSGRNVLGRFYDKGVHPETLQRQPRGQWVRPEDQRRYSAQTRPSVEAVATPGYIRDRFVGRFQTLYKAANGVKVGGPVELAKKLGKLQDEGAITPAQAERVAGALLLETADAQRCSRSTRYERKSEARRLGLILASDPLDEVEVDLGAAIEQALDSDCWGCG